MASRLNVTVCGVVSPWDRRSFSILLSSSVRGGRVSFVSGGMTGGLKGERFSASHIWCAYEMARSGAMLTPSCDSEARNWWSMSSAWAMGADVSMSATAVSVAHLSFMRLL